MFPRFGTMFPGTTFRPTLARCASRFALVPIAFVLAAIAATASAQLQPLPTAMRPASELSGPSVTRPMTFESSRSDGPLAYRPAAFDGPTPLPPIDRTGAAAASLAVTSGTASGSGGATDEITAVPVPTVTYATTGGGIFEPIYASPYGGESCDAGNEPWTVQFFPNGLIYRSYLAGVKEPRFGVQVFHEKDDGWLWDVTLGGRIGLLRYGTTRADRPEGFQIDMEGAAFPRLDPESQMDLNAADFRFGIPFTYGCDWWQVKFAYYHLSSHLGDEYLLRNGLTTRFNFARDALVLGGSYFVLPSVRLYAEADWAFYQDVSQPWAFQFGVEFSPQGPTGKRGTPFVAINGHLRQELDFSGNVVVQAGWQWRSTAGHMFRIGGHYYNGLNSQFALFNDFEEQIGFGVWYDY
ncbi:MAG: DUF1207 domain-containing protein [Pirellulales bacterium]